MRLTLVFLARCMLISSAAAAAAACSQVRRLLQRDPGLRPTPRQLLSERLFQARGVTTTQVII
jgi:hypothetical protein